MNAINTSTIGFIGAGNMAEAIIRGLLERKVADRRQLLASDPSGNRRALLENTFGVSTTTDNRDVVDRCGLILLAVKPQVMGDILAPLRHAFRSDHLIISIAAGIPTQRIDALTGGAPAIVRVMPNTPALIGKGVTALCAGPRADARHLEVAEALFASVGSTLRVEESAMDAVTAVSGSGPAYVFYWMEAMLKAAGELGFDAATARQLVYETFSGAVALAASSSESPEVLRARVTSKGGTTEAAIGVLAQADAGGLLVKALHAAAERSRALSRG